VDGAALRCISTPSRPSEFQRERGGRGKGNVDALRSVMDPPREDRSIEEWVHVSRLPAGGADRSATRRSFHRKKDCTLGRSPLEEETGGSS
jgi:hypothetical protein